MNRLLQPLWLAALAVGLIVAPLASAQAQQAGNLKPVAVVSIAHVDKLLGDIDYLTTAGGAADTGRLVALMAGPYVDGLDKTKPAGLYVTLDGEKPVVIGFVPTKDLTKVLATLADQVGEPKDVGDGVKQLGEFPPMFLKLEGGFTFVTNEQANLAKLPKDPVALLGGLEKSYSIAARINMQNIPQMYKDQMIDQMREGFEAAPIEADDPAQREAAEKIGRNALDQIIRVIDESQDITVGWAVDPTAKSTYLDVVFTAKEGTKLAKEMAMLKDAKTNFAGFLLPDAGFTMNFSSEVTDQDQIQQSVALLETLQASMIKELEKETLDDEEKTEAKALITTVFEVLTATVKEGKSDGGAVALVEPESLTFVAGGQIVDAPKLEGALKRAVAFAQKKQPEELKDVEIKFDASTHGGIRFHKISFPVPDPEAQRVFGDRLNMIVGVGDKSAYLAVGTKAEDTLKKVIDTSAADAGKPVPPGQMNLAVAPFIKFAASVEDNPITAALADAVERVKGNDHVRIHVKPVENGQLVRFEVEEGVIKIIGDAVKSATQGGGF